MSNVVQLAEVAEEHVHAHQLTKVEDVKRFVLAGNARLTLRSKKTGTRFTYSIRKADKEEGDTRPDVWFVGLLTGSDNESSYSYMGIIREGERYTRTAKSAVSATAPGSQAWEWFWPRLWAMATVPANLEVWHEGRCGRCNRLLTVPESIALGIGPECAKQMGLAL